jgi:F0F1-type ATP synthase epsilon subunit
MSQTQTMQVKVYAPTRVYFDAKAASLSAENQTGPFDILPGHKNFMTLLSPCNLTVRVPQRPDFTLPIDRGVMHVKADRVTVFLDI